jgi:AcrR family transcriptional regulator
MGELATAPDIAEAPPLEVKDRIYAAALSLFSQRGYSPVSVREICRVARATPPMVYYYFGSKDGLYKSIRNDSRNVRNRKIAEAARAKGTPMERLRGMLEAWAGVGEDPALRELRVFFSRELFGLDSDSYAKRVEESDRRFRQMLKSILQEGIDAGLFRPVRVEMAVLAISGILNTFSRRAALGAPVTLEEGVDQVMDTFVYGLASRDGLGPSDRA